ncbi:hypothetical protein ACFV0H_07730 [Streptomyces erythrochromogenes]|uniref:hypothetical protein n=1 Tax=Streptomyces erythrochromogenes TaxID=285574 RepID=UPI0036C7C39E
MPLPTTRVVTGHYVNPATGANATGRVVLTPYPGVWTDETHDQVLTGGGTFALVDGAFQQALVTTDAAGVEPATGRLWILEERIAGRPYRRRPFALDAGVDSIDVTDLVDADPGEVTYVRGPEGPAGEQGPAGPQPPLGAAGAGANIALRSTDPTTTDARTPTAHAALHGTGSTDPVTPAAIGAETPAAAQAKADGAQAAAASALSAHAAASDPHGDRAWATGQFYPLASGNALNGYVDDALLRIADLETRMTNAEAETRSIAKTADEPITNNTLQDDNELFLSVVAHGWYEVAMYIDTEGDPAADLTMGWSVPAGAALSWTESGVSAGNTNNIGSIKLQRNDAATASGVGIIAAGSVVLARGVLRVGATAGTLQFRWAQTSTNATPTIVKTGSILKLTRVA